MAHGSPVADSETPTFTERRTEAVMLGLRLAEGLEEARLTPAERARAAGFVASGHLVRRGGRLVATLPGRLIADGVARDILD